MRPGSCGRSLIVKIGLFGGTFDPIHSGHLAAARAACERFALARVYFIPAGVPPQKGQNTPFEHRYAMVVLACAGEPRFVPSLAEAPVRGRPSYSILTVRRFRRMLGPDAELYFLVGADAFLEIRSWEHWRELLDAAHFIVISRPGFDLGWVETVLPRPWERRGGRRDPRGVEYRLRRTSVYLVSGVWVPIAATDIRASLVAAKGASLDVAGLAPRKKGPPAARRAARLVPAAVAEYLEKTGLYNPGGQPRAGGGYQRQASRHDSRRPR